jgi:chromosome segregation ATPase
VEHELVNLRKTVQNGEEELQRCHHNIVNAERQLKAIEAAQGDKLRAYGQNMVSVVKSIQELASRNRWRGITPIGPCGMYIDAPDFAFGTHHRIDCDFIGIHMTCKEVEFTKVIQAILNKDLTSFICTDFQDAKLVREVLRKFRRYVPA